MMEIKMRNSWRECSQCGCWLPSYYTIQDTDPLCKECLDKIQQQMWWAMGGFVVFVAICIIIARAL